MDLLQDSEGMYNYTVSSKEAGENKYMSERFL